MRQQAIVCRIDDLRSIEGIDGVLLATIGDRKVFAWKGDYEIGDNCVFVESDIFLPGGEALPAIYRDKFRGSNIEIRYVMLRGMCLPLSVLPEREGEYEIGEDVTELLCVKPYGSYEEAPPEPATQRHSPVRRFLLRTPFLHPLARLLTKRKKQKQGWPEFIPKTDETCIQSVPFILSRKDLGWEVHEKVDGLSATFFLMKLPKAFPWSRQRYDFGICSHDQRLTKPDESPYWKIAEKYQLENKLKQLIGDNEFVAIQGEIIGPDIRGNKYQVTEPDLYCFNLIYPEGKMDSIEAAGIVVPRGLKWVPLIRNGFVLPDTVEEMLTFATGQSALADTLREGVVIRCHRAHLSFKVVSPDFLIKWNE